jgi:hypothetical protein
MKRVMRDAPIRWLSRVKRLVLRGEILGFQLGDLLFQRKSGQSLGQFQKRGGDFTPRRSSGGSKQVGGGGLLRCRGHTN